ncbi:MAG: hypothetical protein ABJF67_16880 [Aurantimonas coralicida]|uniref:hypothetical protein n=1 Tax=Nisaea sp. TaxID=2024842 RepID=UPI0032666D17
MIPHPVTDHAVVRYFERVHQVDFEALFPDARHDGQRMTAICRYLDIQPSEARDLVCPPRLHAGIYLGATLIRAARHRMICAGGRVVTVVIPTPKPRHRRRPTMEIAA